MLVPEYLADVPPGAKLVYLALESAEEPLTGKALIEETKLSSRGVSESIERLRDAGAVIVEAPNVGDLRQTKYELRPHEEG